MKPIFRRQQRGVPGLNLASMPDLIFTVLFFFMLVTHMRQDNVKVSYEVPEGTEVKKMEQRQGVVNVYVGRDGQLQVNDRLVTLDQLNDVINDERSQLSAELQERMTISLKADRKTPMGLIGDVKQELKKAYALKINYAGRGENEK